MTAGDDDSFIAMKREFDRTFCDRIASYRAQFRDNEEFIKSVSSLAPAVFLFYARDGVSSYSYADFIDFLRQQDLKG